MSKKKSRKQTYYENHGGRFRGPRYWAERKKRNAGLTSSVKVSYLPGYGPPPPSPPESLPSPHTKFPFKATITARGRTYEVEVTRGGMRFLRWVTA